MPTPPTPKTSTPPEITTARPATAPGQTLPTTVVWIGVVSFLTDASGEMIYPLLPLFLTTVLGASAASIGVIEGIAEATASLFKLVSGRIADTLPRKKPLVVAGYTLSSLARPLVALATAPWMVLAVRFTDRVGKGIRSSPRDAIVADVTPREERGHAYGYHRAMDNAGAVVGPLVGYALMTGLGVKLQSIFGWAALPGALAVAALVFGVKEKPRVLVARVADPPLPATADAASQHTGIATQHGDAALQRDAGVHEPAAPRGALARYLVAVGVFTLGNASDAFLLLRASDTGISQGNVLLLWTVHNGVKAALSRSLGALSDRIGRRRLIVGGWLLYALCYLGFAFATEAWQIWALFVVYGLYYALVEGPERALVADLAGPARRGTAFGWFHGVTGVLALPASVMFGVLYRYWGAVAAFGTAAALAAVAAVLLIAMVSTRPDEQR